MWELNKKPSGEKDENFTFLGRGVDFQGVIRFEGTVRVDGRLEGEIHTKGTLIVGEHAMIKGTVSAGVLVCGGKIHAAVTATEKVQLLKSAVVIGDIRAPLISMEEGAHHHGLCDMGVKKTMDPVTEDLVQPDNVHNLALHRGKVRVQESSQG